MPEIKPLQIYKKAGLTGPAEVAEISGVSVRTLNHWQKTRPFVFNALLHAAAKQRGVESDQ